MKTKLKVPVEALFRAFSDRTRLRILSLLSGGELCVCDLVEVLGVPQPKASRHLAYLRRVGLVASRKEGYWSYYRIATDKGGLRTKLLACLDDCADELPELAKDRRGLQGRCGKNCCE